jgi:hypothetical protein
MRRRHFASGITLTRRSGLGLCASRGGVGRRVRPGAEPASLAGRSSGRCRCVVRRGSPAARRIVRARLDRAAARKRGDGARRKDAPKFHARRRPATSRYKRRMTIAPSTDARNPAGCPAPYQPISRPNHAARNDPPMPSRMVMMKPPGSRPGNRSFAKIPTINPTTTATRMLMRKIRRRRHIRMYARLQMALPTGTPSALTSHP